MDAYKDESCTSWHAAGNAVYKIDYFKSTIDGDNGRHPRESEKVTNVKNSF